MHLSGDLTKRGTTSDDVTVVITADGAPVLQQTLAGGATGTVAVNRDIPVHHGQVLQWRVQVDSPVDVDQISWTPRAYYTAADGLARTTDGNGNPLVDLFPPYTLDIYPTDSLTAPQGSYHVPADGQLSVAPQLSFDFGAGPADRAHRLHRQAPRPLLGKAFFDIHNGVVSAPGPLTVTASAGDDLFFDFSTLDPTLRPVRDRPLRHRGRLGGRAQRVPQRGGGGRLPAAVPGLGRGRVQRQPGPRYPADRADRPRDRRALRRPAAQQRRPAGAEGRVRRRPAGQPAEGHPFTPSPAATTGGARGPLVGRARTRSAAPGWVSESIALPVPSDFAGGTAVPRLSRPSRSR